MHIKLKYFSHVYANITAMIMGEKITLGKFLEKYALLVASHIKIIKFKLLRRFSVYPGMYLIF